MNHTAHLDQLRQAVAKERRVAREAEAHAKAEQDAATAAREQLVEAHATGSGVRKAEQALAKARDKAEAAGIRAEGATRRVERAEQEALAYETSHVQDLIDELEPQATAAAERLAESARQLYDAHTAWHAVATKVNALLRVAGTASSTPADHGLGRIAHDVRNFLRQSGEIAAPLPRDHATHRHEAPKVAA